MISRWLRRRFGRRLTRFLSIVARRKITPATLSVAGLAMMLFAGTALSLHHFRIGAVAMLIGGMLDALDGELARITSTASDYGSFLDSLCDHAGDAAVYFGLLLALFGSKYETDTILIFLGMFGSLFGSQVRARAELAGIGLKDVGIATRFERLIVLVFGLLVGGITAALCAVAFISNLSALQRIVYALNEARRSALTSTDARKNARRSMWRTHPGTVIPCC
jgi:archaetidylinositol phosphate synthase